MHMTEELLKYIYELPRDIFEKYLQVCRRSNEKLYMKNSATGEVFLVRTSGVQASLYKIINWGYNPNAQDHVKSNWDMKYECLISNGRTTALGLEEQDKYFYCSSIDMANLLDNYEISTKEECSVCNVIGFDTDILVIYDNGYSHVCIFGDKHSVSITSLPGKIDWGNVNQKITSLLVMHKMTKKATKYDTEIDLGACKGTLTLGFDLSMLSESRAKDKITIRWMNRQVRPTRSIRLVLDINKLNNTKDDQMLYDN